MRGELVAAVILLSALTFPPGAQGAEGGVATLEVCNHGAIAIDVFTAINGSATPLNSRYTRVENWHIAPGACQQVYRNSSGWGNTGEPADIGFAFVDSSGKWGAATVDHVPDLGRYNPSSIGEILGRTITGDPIRYDILTASDRPFCIRRAKTQYNTESVSESDCRGFQVQGDRNSEPYVALQTALHYHPTFSSCSTLAGRTFCGDGDYLNVTANPATHEVTVTRGSAEGADKPNDGGTDAADIMKALQEAAKHSEEGEQQRRASEQTALAQQYAAAQARDDAARRSASEFSRQWMGQYVIVKGTVSRAEIGGLRHELVNLYFRESPDGAFAVCMNADYNQLLPTKLGAPARDWSALVGKTIEARGFVNQFPGCGGKSGSLQVRFTEVDLL